MLSLTTSMIWSMISKITSIIYTASVREPSKTGSENSMSTFLVTSVQLRELGWDTMVTLSGRLCVNYKEYI